MPRVLYDLRWKTSDRLTVIPQDRFQLHRPLDRRGRSGRFERRSQGIAVLTAAMPDPANVKNGMRPGRKSQSQRLVQVWHWSSPKERRRVPCVAATLGCFNVFHPWRGRSLDGAAGRGPELGLERMRPALRRRPRRTARADARAEIAIPRSPMGRGWKAQRTRGDRRPSCGPHYRETRRNSRP